MKIVYNLPYHLVQFHEMVADAQAKEPVKNGDLPEGAVIRNFRTTAKNIEATIREFRMVQTQVNHHLKHPKP